MQMKRVTMVVSTVILTLFLSTAHSAEPTAKGKAAEPIQISLAGGKWLEVEDMGQLGIGSIFKLAYDGTGRALPEKATVVCEMTGLQNANDQSGKAAALSLCSFHSVNLKGDKGDTTASFWSASYKATGTGKMRIYLVENISPKPEPQRVFVMAVGLVYLGSGSFAGVSEAFKIEGKEYKVVPLSNVLEVQVAAGSTDVEKLKTTLGPPAKDK